MNTQDLKNSIMQLAIQGKLTDRLETDSSVSEAIVSMKSKREQLIKEKKLRKDGKINYLTDNNKLDIPENWRFVLLKELICKKVDNRGKTPPHSTVRFNDYIDLLEINSLIPGNRVTRENVEKFISKETYDNSLRGYVEEDDILIATVGSIGKISLMDNEIGAIAQNIIAIRCFEEVNQKYIFYLLQSPYFYTQMNSVTMKAVQASIKVPDLLNLRVPLPPLEEQKRIVAKIEELMPYVEKYDKAYSAVEGLNKKFPVDMQKSILQYAVQGKLVEQREEEGTGEELYQRIQEGKEKLIKEGKIKKSKKITEITEDEIPFDIPENWKWIKLGDIFEINPRNNVNDDTTVSFIPMTLIEDGYRSEYSYETKLWVEVKKGYTHFRDGDIVMAKITPCFQNLKSAIMLNLENGVGAGTTELHVLRAYNDISLEFFLWFIKSPIFVSTCVTKMTGTAGQQRVGTDTITNYVAPLPPIEEQKRIVAKIAELLPYCKQLVK